MKKVIALILTLIMLTALVAACGEKAPTPTPTPTPAATPTPEAPDGDADADADGDADADSDGFVITTGVPTLAADAATRAADAYAFIAELAAEAAKFDRAKAQYKYTVNCHDPAASAVGEFLYAWSDAVLIATEGAVDMQIGVSNAYCADGTMETLNNMIAGSIDFTFTLPCYFRGYMPLTNAIQNPGLGIKNATVAAYAMWDLYKNNAEVQAEYAANGEVLFVWANNPSPLSYKGTAELTSVAEISGNIRGNNGPAQMFIEAAGGSIFGCPIGDVYTNVSTGVINYLITDWHGISSFSLNDAGVLNYYLDTNIGCSAYTLMGNDAVWSQIEKNGYADAIKSVSGDYLLNMVGIWEAYEAKGREGAIANGGTIYEPSGSLAAELEALYTQVGETWISTTGGSAEAVYNQAKGYVDQYNATYK